jgi:hypothetical protein
VVYSPARSLPQKLGIKPGFCILVTGAPVDYRALLGPLPARVTVVTRPRAGIDMVHLFAPDAATLTKALPAARAAVGAKGLLWVSWPKKAANVPTDLSDIAVRALVLPTGLVDVKVCAMDSLWSGLKFVVRKSWRPA